MVNTNVLKNVNIDGYKLHAQPTRSSHGGVALYVKESLHHGIRWDLSVLDDDFESLWAEIKTGHKSKNILCCCTYRHPNTDVGKFTEHLESVVSKYDKPSKIISMMGDFNINLLEREHHTDTNNFVNSMVTLITFFLISYTPQWLQIILPQSLITYSQMLLTLRQSAATSLTK